MRVIRPASSCAGQPAINSLVSPFRRGMVPSMNMLGAALLPTGDDLPTVAQRLPEPVFHTATTQGRNAVGRPSTPSCPAVSGMLSPGRMLCAPRRVMACSVLVSANRAWNEASRTCTQHRPMPICATSETLISPSFANPDASSQRRRKAWHEEGNVDQRPPAGGMSRCHC